MTTTSPPSTASAVLALIDKHDLSAPLVDIRWFDHVTPLDERRRIRDVLVEAYGPGVDRTSGVISDPVSWTTWPGARATIFWSTREPEGDAIFSAAAAVSGWVRVTA